MDKKRYVDIVRGLFKSYGKDLDKDQATAWYKILKDYSDVEFEQAINNLCKTSHFFPSVAQIIEMIENSQELSLWNRILLCIRECPYYLNSSADEENVKRMYEILKDDGFKVINMIGYENLCLMDSRDKMYYKKMIENYEKEFKIAKKENLKLQNNSNILEFKE